MSQKNESNQSLDKRFECLGLSRNTLLVVADSPTGEFKGKLGQADVAKLSDEEMQSIADQIGKVCQEVFFKLIEDLVRKLIADKEKAATRAGN